MPLADIIALNRTRMTNQQLADLAWYEDRARRAAEARGDAEAACGHEREAVALCALMSPREAAWDAATAQVERP